MMRRPFGNSHWAALAAAMLLLSSAAVEAQEPIRLPDARVGSPYVFSFDAQGLIEPVRYAIEFAPRIPEGLNLEGAWLHGAPSPGDVGAFTGTVRATGALGDAAPVRTFSLQVRPKLEPLELGDVDLGVFIFGEPIDEPLIARGGEGRQSWRLMTAGSDLDVEVRCGEDDRCRLVGTANVLGVTRLQLEVRDPSAASDVGHVTLNVVRRPAPPVVVCAAPPPAFVSVPYVYVLCVRGGHSPYRWRLAWQGPAPDGLTLDAGRGVIHGTPTRAGAHRLALTLTDNNGFDAKSREVDFEVRLRPEVAAVQILPDALPDGEIGQPYAAQAVLWRNEGRWDWSEDQDLPTWAKFTVDGDRASITGVPTNQGATELTLRAVAGEQKLAASRTINIKPAPAPLSYGVDRLAPIVAGIAVDRPLPASGGRGDYRWEADTAELPKGLAVNCKDADCRLHGVAEETGVYALTLTLSDSLQTLSPKRLPLQVLPAPSVPPTVCDAPPPAAVVGVAYRYRLCVEGGRGPFDWALTWANGAPPGLTFADNGAIVGRPVRAGSYSASVALRDLASGGETVSDEFLLEIKPEPTAQPPRILPLRPPIAVVGRSYEAQFAVLGHLEGDDWTPEVEAPDWLRVRRDGRSVVLTGEKPIIGHWQLVFRSPQIAPTYPDGVARMTIEVVEAQAYDACVGMTPAKVGPLLNPRRRDDAASIQTALKQTGDYRAAVDGLWGAGSIRALRAFEEANGLPVDGEWSACDQGVLLGVN